MGKLLNPFIDFAFKYLFGREEHKHFLIDLLNGLLQNEPDFDPIVDLTYLDKEKGKRKKKERGVIYDIHCETSHGRRFVVEMQNDVQEFFFERTIYYASRGIVEQGRSGKDWKYKYMTEYCVSMMNFVQGGYQNSPVVNVGLCDLDSKQQFSDKIRLIYIQTPLFEKNELQDCKTDLDKWMYNIVNMGKMETMAFTDEKVIFAEFEEVASYASLSDEERAIYDADLKAYRDIHNQMDYAVARGEARGKAQGLAEGKAEGLALGEARKQRQIILNMRSLGLDAKRISEYTGIPIDDILTI